MRTGWSALAVVLASSGCLRGQPKGVHTDAAPKTQRSEESWEDRTDDHAKKMLEEGRNTSTWRRSWTTTSAC